MLRHFIHAIKTNSIISIFSVALILFAACAAAQAPTLEEAQ